MAKWIAFWVLGIIWGSSFLLIRVGVEELSPFQLVFIRTLIAAVGLNLVLLARGKHLPFNRRALLPLLIIGVGNTAIPFALITWGEQTVTSSVAAVLQSVATLFTAVVAHFVFADERLTLQKIIGLIVGFAGVAVITLVGSGAQGFSVEVVGALAIVLASVFYAVFTTYSRVQIKNRFEPMMVSAGAMTFAAIVSGIAMIAAPFLNGQAPTPLDQVSSDALIAVVLLGLLNTFIAYTLFYWIVQKLGAARSAMVTYIVPGVGVVLGALVLGEPITAGLIVGALLILAGIAVVNVRLGGVFRQRAPVGAGD